MRQNKKILIVEDELLVALVYEQFLGKKGYSILGPFTTGAEAISFVKQHEFDVALIDVQLDDDISGITVAEKIREKSDVLIIFTTGNDSRKTEKESSHISNAYILPKPIDFKALLKILES